MRKSNVTSKGLGLRALSKNIRQTVARQIIAAGLGLFTTIVIARVYGPEGNGGLALALLLPSLLATILNLGVAPATAYYLASGTFSLREVVAANLRILIVISISGLCIGAAILAWGKESFFPGVPPALLWVALSIFPVELLKGYLLGLFQGIQQFRAYNLIAITQPVVVLGLVFLFSMVEKFDILLVVVAQVASQVVTVVFAITFLKPIVRSTVEKKSPFRKIDFKILSYGWKAHLANIITFINYKADIFLVNIFLGPSVVGIYVISAAIAETLWLLSKAVGTVLFPRLSELRTDETARMDLTPLVARWVLLITSLAGAILAMISYQLVTTVFGAAYAGAFTPLLCLMPGIILLSGGRVLANDIAARGRPELNMYASSSCAAVNIFCNLILIPLFGLAGAAIATTIAYSSMTALVLLFYIRLSKNGWIEVVFIKSSDLRLLREWVNRR